MKVGSNNKPELALQNVQYISDIFPEETVAKTESLIQDSNAGSHSKK